MINKDNQTVPEERQDLVGTAGCKRFSIIGINPCQHRPHCHGFCCVVVVVAFF